MESLNRKDLYKQEPPPFGKALLKHYALDPEYLNLNNGSYGTTPRPVLEAANELTLLVESNPDRFNRLLYQPMLIDVRTKVATLIGAKADEVVLVANASMGVNTILRNFDWEAGDVIFAFTTTYGSVSRTVQNLSDCSPFPSVCEIPLNFPMTHAEVLESFKEHLKLHPAGANKKRVAVIDSIVSNPGVLLPWQEMVKICREENVWSLVDAAHSIGQEVDLNMEESKPDFFVSNCHKWLSSKRACALLYVPERNQHIIKTSLPTSHTYIRPADRVKPNFVEQFEWNGTIDFTPYLTVADAIEFRQWLGGEHKINAYCHDLALKGGRRLAEVLGTRVIDPDGDLTVNMVNVELPIPGSIKWTAAIDASMKQKMLVERKAYSAHFYHNGAWWTRCSAQVWNNVEDFENIGIKWREVCAEIVMELKE
ncbi:pyridoxal phosphate-dependent transferase [Crassisporium funariophilum]|nr:pyridoxal phosphate-dependent transferase [Crassisporium funariophilum]